MRKEVRKVANMYVKEFKAAFPHTPVELIDEQTPWVDAREKTYGSSQDEIDEVSELLAHLTPKHYLDEGVYITGSASHSGPVPVS